MIFSANLPLSHTMKDIHWPFISLIITIATPFPTCKHLCDIFEHENSSEYCIISVRPLFVNKVRTIGPLGTQHRINSKYIPTVDLETGRPPRLRQPRYIYLHLSQVNRLMRGTGCLWKAKNILGARMHSSLEKMLFCYFDCSVVPFYTLWNLSKCI